MRQEKCDFFRFVKKKYYGGELPQNYFSLHEKLPNKSKFKSKKLEKIYVARDKQIKLTCFRISTKNYFMAGNHP